MAIATGGLQGLPASLLMAFGAGDGVVILVEAEPGHRVVLESQVIAGPRLIAVASAAGESEHALVRFIGTVARNTFTLARGERLRAAHLFRHVAGLAFSLEVPPTESFAVDDEFLEMLGAGS